MTPRPQAVRIGLFAVGGLLLLGAALVAIFGLKVFVEDDRARLHFPGTVQGLPVGATVNFRGVRIGGVRQIRLVSEDGRPGVVVVVELDRQQLRAIAGVDGGDPLQPLLGRGLTAQLARQSLLTGQAYVDLDLRPAALATARPAVAASSQATPTAAGASAAAPAASGASAAVPAAAGASAAVPATARAPGAVRAPAPGAAATVDPRFVGLPDAVAALPRIPTTRGGLDALQEQLEGFDLAGLGGDLRGTLQATRELVAGPALRQPLADIGQAAAALARVSQTVQQRLPRLVDTAQGTLRQAGQASARIGGVAERLGPVTERAGAAIDRAAGAADRAGAAADRVGSAAGRADALLAPDSPLVSQLQRAADELARSAAVLRETAGADAPPVQAVQRAMGDLSRAARAVRDLAEGLEQQPQSLLRGKPAVPPEPVP